MPLFRVEGRGKDSGRKRKPFQVLAKDEKAARRQALKRGTKPDAIERVDITHFATHVAGTSFKNHRNQGGRDRQDVVRSCKGDIALVLEREKGNPLDKHAIRVLSQREEEQIGYLPAEIAEQIAVGFCDGGGCQFAVHNSGAKHFGDEDSPLTLEITVLVTTLDVEATRVRTYIESELSGFPLGSIPLSAMAEGTYQPATRSAKPNIGAAEPKVGAKSRRSQERGCLGAVLLLSGVVTAAVFAATFQ